MILQNYYEKGCSLRVFNDTDIQNRRAYPFAVFELSRTPDVLRWICSTGIQRRFVRLAFKIVILSAS